MRKSSDLKQNTKLNNLAKKLSFTLGVIGVFRFMSCIPLPDVNQTLINEVFLTKLSSTNLSFLGKTGPTVLNQFEIGILPSINAAIIIQLLIAASPQLQNLQKNEGESGKRQVTRLTRIITLVVSIAYSLSLLNYINETIFAKSLETLLVLGTSLVSGSMVVTWLSEIITEKGLGNGSSIFICLNIVDALPKLVQNRDNLSESTYSALVFIFALIGIIYIQEAFHRIPLTSVKQLGKEEYEQPNNYLPFRLNQASVTPVVFASTFLIIPSFILKNLAFTININEKVYAYGSIGVYIFLIIIFSYFYSTLILDPNNLSEDLKKISVNILGLRPGEQTESLLARVLSRLSLMGGSFIAFTTFGTILLNSNQTGLLKNFGATSVIILVGVFIDIIRQIKSLLLSQNYKQM